MLTRSLILLALLLASAPLAAAGPLHSVDALDALITAHLGAEVGARGGARAPVDRRLRLKRCAAEPAVELRGGNVLISCPDQGWRFAVPVARAAPGRVDTAANIIAIKRGQPVRLTVRRGSFTVTRNMIADRSGKLGDLIPVRADRRATPVLALVTGVGSVTVPD